MSTQPSDDLLTIRDWLRYACTCFAGENLHYGHGTDNVWDEAVFLVLRSLSLPLDDNTVFLDARLTRDERECLAGRIERRVEERIPAPYLVGEAWFMGIPFHVDERVLIPRSPLGELLANELQPWVGNRPIERILDLCTGSGCIGIGAALVFEEASVDLTDVSGEALALAQKNIALHDVADRVQTLQSDVFDAVPGRYDVILANPPYVDSDDMTDIPAEFRHEPALGLAAGDDGLDVVRRILTQAADHLTPGGVLIGEVGNSEAALEAAFPELPLTWIELEQGGHGVFLLQEQDLRQFINNS